MATRRGFLQMLGGAIAAPLMPSASLGAAAKVGYPASALHAAVYHAQSQLNFSVFSLAQRLGLDLGQAEELMGDMVDRGILGPMQGTTRAGRWARSNVWQHPFAEAATAQKAARKAQGTDFDKSSTQSWSEPDMGPVLRRLYEICRAQGRELHPRCAEFVA